jgi:hypothetical protein
LEITNGKDASTREVADFRKNKGFEVVLVGEPIFPVRSDET